MKSRIQLVVGLLTAMGVSAAVVMAQEKAVDAAKAKPHSDAAPMMPHVKKHHTGMLSEKPADAAAEIVAVLTVKDKEGKEAKYNVTAADSAVADKVKALISKEATVTGDLNADKTAIAATEVAEKVAKPAGEAKPKVEKPAVTEKPAVEAPVTK